MRIQSILFIWFIGVGSVISLPAAVSSGAAQLTKAKTPEQSVLVCMGGSSVRYHAHERCRGLSNCSTKLSQITTVEARSLGRTPCGICKPQ